MANDTLQKFGDSMSRAITKFSVKTSSTLEKSKIKMHIDSLTKEMQQMLMDIGNHAYDIWANGGTSNEALSEQFAAVQQKKAEIERLAEELLSIDDRDNEIFGTKVEEKAPQKPAPEKNLCPNCGSECEPTARFCRKCGTKIG